MKVQSLIRFLALAFIAVGCGGIADDDASRSGQDGWSGKDTQGANGANDKQEGQGAQGGNDGSSAVPPGSSVDAGDPGFVDPQCGGEGHGAEIWGRRVNEAERCAGKSEFIECGEFEACGAAMTYARSPSGELWEFPSTCTPAGWPVAYPSDDSFIDWSRWLCEPEVPEPVDCASVLPEDCWQHSSQCLQIIGLRVDEAKSCWVDKETVGCIQYTNCDGLAVYARSPSGVLWTFGNQCIPDGWVVEEPVGGANSMCPP